MKLTAPAGSSSDRDSDKDELERCPLLELMAFVGRQDE